MLTFKEMTFELTESRNVYMMLRNPDRVDGDESTPYGWHFCWSWAEWTQMVKRSKEGPSIFRDGYHIADIMIPGWITFIDTDQMPSGAYGKMPCRFYRMEVPHEALVAINHRLEALKAEAALEPGYTARPRLEVSMSDRQGWLAHFGQGKGSVKLVFGEGAEERLMRDIEEDKRQHAEAFGEPRLERIFQQWIQMARNSTYKKTEEATLRISKDGEGYYVEALTPRGQRIMNGGWVDHGNAEASDWSAHT